MAAVEMLTVLLLNGFFGFVSSLFFHIGDTGKNCFIEEMPDDTGLMCNYRTELYDERRDEYLPASQDVALYVEVKDPDDELVLSRSHGSEGSFNFTSQKPGGFQICLQSNSSQRPLPAGGLLAVHLDIRVAERTNNYAEVAAKERLTELQLRVRQLTEQVLQIQRVQDYHRLREKDFRQLSHSINMWIFWWPVVRSLYVVFTIMWNTRSC